MNDILIHHGILGQKWGVRRYQNKDGSLTRAGKDRYGVGDAKNDPKEILSSMTKEYKDKYDQRLKELKENYSTGLISGKLSHDKIMDLVDYLGSMQARMGQLSDGETPNLGRIERDYDFRKSCELVGVNLNMESSGKASIHLASLNLVNAHTTGNRKEYDEALKQALDYVAVYDAMLSMPNTNYLPYVQEELAEYYENIQNKDEEQKKLNGMMEELKKAGLYDLKSPVEIRNISSNDYNGLMYCIKNGEHYEYFRPDQIKDLQKFAIKNNLYGKDFRDTINGQKTREKNIDTSSGAKSVKKRSKVEISDQERAEKEANSKASLEKASKRLSDSIQDYKIRKEKEQTERSEKKKNYEKFVKRKEGYSESLLTKAKISVNQTLKKAGKKVNNALKNASSQVQQGKTFVENFLKKVLKHEDVSDILIHHGILNQKWGVRNGPPYPLGGGDYSPSEKRAIKGQRRLGNSIYNKKHFDEVLKKDKTTLSTLSYDENRTKNVDMFYAVHDIWDNHQYNALFNRKVPKTLYDESGKAIGTGNFLKFRIDNSLKSDIKVASEDSAAKIFKDLYKRDRDFYNFVTDKSRMEDYFVKEKYKFKGYREAGDVLKKMRSGKYNPTENDIQTLYRMFNYVIPYDGQGNVRKGNDVAKQRAKFFKELKSAGYGAVLDTNDAIYGGFKARSPVIVFDMEQIIPKGVYQTTMNDKVVSEAALALRKLIGI